MALSRQGSLFSISEDSITRALGGDTSPQAAAVAGSSTAAEAETLESDGDGFGAEQATARASQSEFSEKDPKTAAASAEKWRRDVNSPLNIGGGGGALYTADKNPFSDGDNDDAANDALGEMVETSQQSLKRDREERLKAWQAQWDVAMSEDVEGLTNAEVLSSLKRINRNPRKAAEDAFQRGDIKEEDIPTLMRYSQLWEQNEEYKRNHNGESNPALVTEMKTLNDKSEGRVAPAAKINVKNNDELHKTAIAAPTLDARDGGMKKSVAGSYDALESDAPELLTAVRHDIASDGQRGRGATSADARTGQLSASQDVMSQTTGMTAASTSDPMLANPIQAQSPRDAFKTAAEGSGGEKPKLAVAVAPATAIKPEAMTI
jgi:hypothetical protein